MITDKTIRMNDNMVTDKTIMMHNPMTTEKTIMLMNDDQDLSNKTILENTSSNHQKDSDINVLNNDESGKKIENSYHNESKHPHKNVRVNIDSKRSNSNQEKFQPKSKAMKYDRK